MTANPDPDTTWVRPNEFVVDLGAVSHNAARLRQAVGHRFIYASLKADAYGYGLAAIADTLVASGVDGFALVSIADAVQLRSRGHTQPILLYSGVPFTTTAVEAIEAYALTPTVSDLASARRLAQAAKGPVRVYLEVDAGLGRLGVEVEQAPALIAGLHTLPQLQVTGLYAHMHVASGAWRPEYLAWQMMRFGQVQRLVEDAGLPVEHVMVASTGILLGTTELGLTAVDPGRWFYGLTGAGAPKGASAGLLPAFDCLRTALTEVKSYERSEFLQDMPFAGTVPDRIGVIPVGWADGMNQLNVGEVLVHDRRVKVLGRPFIEHTRIDLSEVPEAVPGDRVILIGGDSVVRITPEEVADHNGVSSPCLLALSVGSAFHRVYTDRRSR